MARAGLGGLLLALAGTASAHDTWFQPLSAHDGQVLLALGTGVAWPALQTPARPDALTAQGCARGDGAVQALQPVRSTATALLMHSHGQSPVTACWAALGPFEIELTPEVVARYLDEVAAPEEVRAAWAQQQARGVGWREHYRKHARIELGGTAAPQPAPLALDVVLDAPAPLVSGAPLALRVLRNGQPLAGFPIELRGADGGRWLRTDDQGRVRTQAPAPGHWLLRGTRLQLAATTPDVWDSEFVTLAFDVVAGPNAAP